MSPKNLLALVAAGFILGIGSIASSHAQSGIDVLSSREYIDQLGLYHIVGQVQNNSDDVVKLVEITANLHDSEQTVIARATGYTFIDVLRPKEKSAFHLVFTDAALISRIDGYKLIVDVGVLTSDKHRLLELNIGEGYIDDLGFYHLVGQVTNNGGNLARFVEVSAALYDGDGRIVDTAVGYTSPSNIEPGDTESFEIQSVSPSGNAIRSVSANADSTEYATVPEFPVAVLAALAGVLGVVVMVSRLKSRPTFGT